MFNEFILFGVTGDSRNGDSIEKFISIDIYSNNVFLQILASPVTGDLHGIQRVNMNSKRVAKKNRIIWRRLNYISIHITR